MTATTPDSPIPRKVRSALVRYRCKLDTIDDIRHEASRLYRESRGGILDVTDCSKYIYCLKQIASLIETGDLEKRIESLEIIDATPA